MAIALSGSLAYTGSLLVTGGMSINGTAVGTGGLTGVSNTFTANYYNPKEGAIQVATQVGQGSLHMQPMTIPQAVRFDRIIVPIAYSNATNSSNSFTVSFWAGFYTNNNSSLSLATSVSTSYNVTNSGTAGSYSIYGGTRNLFIGTTGTISAGAYYLGLLSRTTTGGGAGMTMSNFIVSQVNNSFSGVFGAASNTSAQMTQGLGMYSATTNAMPNSIGFNQLVGQSSAYLRPYVFALSNATATSV